MNDFYINPCLIVYPKTIQQKRHFVAEVNCANAPLIIHDYRIVQLLNQLPLKFSESDFIEIAKQSNIEIELSKELFSLFLGKEIVTNSEVNDSTKDLWYRYGWQEAFKYHYGTRDYPFIEMDKLSSVVEDSNRMHRYNEVSKPPSIYQEFKHTKRIVLEKIDKQDSNHLLKSIQVSGQRSLKDLSLIFDLCFGERGKLKFGIQGEFLKKSIPSGGARHTTEVFFIAFENMLLEPGVYHYNVQYNSLDLLKSGSFFDQAKLSTFDLFDKFADKPTGLFVFTSLHERAMWRYRDARSWRAVLVDIGHALMLQRKILKSLGYKSYTYQKFKDDLICELIGLDYIKQTPLFVATLI